MEAMVVQLDPLSRCSYGPFGEWVRHDTRREDQEMPVDTGATILHSRTLSPRLQDGTLSRGVPNTGCRSLARQNRATVSSRQIPISTRTGPLTASTSPTSSSSTIQSPTPPILSGLVASLSSFTFTKAIGPSPDKFSFTPSGLSGRAAAIPKRLRSPADVDGPNTAALPSKKRRLRRHLITSRLSQPFSLPATHILNREAGAAGDKRFFKLAAVTNARRLAVAGHHALAGHPGASEMLRRAAIINRFRLRVCVEAEQRGDEGVARLAGNAGLLQLSQGLGVVNAPFPMSAGAPLNPFAGTPSEGWLRPIPPPGQPHPLSRAAAAARSSPPGSPQGLRPADSRSAGLRVPSISPRLSPLSRPARERDLEDDEVDDEVCSFPLSELDPSDEPDDVYADFSVIFRGGSDVDSDEEREGYEDYMDDMDGIPWTAR